MQKLQNTGDILQNDIISIAGYWEPIAFIKRGGRAYDTIDKDEYPYSEQMALHLKNIGVSTVIWHYFKGLGIKTEEEEMKRTASFFKHCEKAGLAKGVYINFGSIFADVFFAENPQFSNRLAIDQFGMPHQYSEFYRIYYRVRPCSSHKKYSDYIAKVSIKAIREAGADLISFDNAAQMPCYCENCKKGFLNYLLSKYPEKSEKGKLSFKERFGYDFLGAFQLPRGTARQPIDNLPAAYEPGLYEWIRYRQFLYEESMKNAVNQIRQYSSKTKIQWNIALDEGEFPGLVWGLDAETSIRCGTDFFFSEDGNQAGIENEQLISHIRTYKYGYALKNRVGVHNTLNRLTDNPQRQLLNYAEAAALNQGCLGHVMWATEPDDGRFDMLKKAIAFFRKNKDVCLNSRPLASVAVFRCAESEIINWAYTTLSRLAVEQVLIKSNIQFNYILNGTLDDLFKYKVFVCPNTVAVDETAIKKIADFVRHGGKIICTEESFSKDGHGFKREAIADMGMVGERDSQLGRNPVRTEAEKILGYIGLKKDYSEAIFYIPSLKFAKEFMWDPRSSAIPIVGKEYYVEPLNKDEILGSLHKALEIDDVILRAPVNVIAGLFEMVDGSQVVHVFDYGLNGTITDAQVRINLKDRIVNYAYFQTLTTKTDILLEKNGDYGNCVLPNFETYGFLRIVFQN